MSERDHDTRRSIFGGLIPMEEPEIYDLEEPEEPCDIQLYRSQNRINREQGSLAGIYNGAFRLAQKNPFFKRRFISMINENLNLAHNDTKIFDQGYVEPHYRLYKQDNDEFTYYLDVQLPYVSKPNEIDLCLSPDRIIIGCLHKNTLLNLLLPVAINYRAVTNYFDKITRELRLKIPIEVNLNS